MVDKFHLGELWRTGDGFACDFIGDDDLLDVVKREQDVQSVRFAAGGITAHVRFQPGVDAEEAWLRLYYALEARVAERKAEFRSGLATE